MIRVEIHYYKKTFQSGREKFIYKDIFVSGHSSDGTINSIKCCAGVTAVTCGLIHLLSESTCLVQINKGFFHYKKGRFEEEINYAVNALVFQLENIYNIYPQFFSEFNFIEEKETDEENINQPTKD